MQMKLTPLEIASSIILGIDAHVAPLPETTPGYCARDVLEDIMFAALRRPPCVISFSGGRDSSAILALAVKVARTNGLPLPIPVTLCFPHVESANETQWQDIVVRHLGLPEWLRLMFTDELDIVGPIAADVMRDCGLLWPFNTHFHVPVFQQASGGTVLTGVGGDEVLSPARFARPLRLLHGRARPRGRDVLSLAATVSSWPGRAQYLRRSHFASNVPWLQQPIARDLDHHWRRSVAREPVRWDRWVRETYWCQRRRAIGEESLAVLAVKHRTAVQHPLSDPRFLGVLAGEIGPLGFGSRTQAMRHLFADVLPDALLTRTSKATFDPAFWSTYAQAFARHWSGAYVDEAIVDVEALRRLWASGAPPAVSFFLLQAVWMKSRGWPLAAERAYEPVDRFGHL